MHRASASSASKATPWSRLRRSNSCEYTSRVILLLTCTLKFGSTPKQTIVLQHNEAPVEVSLQGAGPLTAGSIMLSCTVTSSKDSVSNLSLIAYVVTGIN